MENQKPVYLRCLDVANNHYKYYRMIPQSDGTFTAEFGREGAKPQIKSYPMSVWDKTYRSKLKKGYEDKTEHFVVTQTVNNVTTDISRLDKDGNVYAEISDNSVRELVTNLQSYSNKIIDANYDIGTEFVTQHMIDDAQTCIDNLVAIVSKTKINIHDFNIEFAKLLNVVPRKIGNSVVKYLVPETLKGKECKDKCLSVIKFEEELLDNMRTRVATDMIINDVSDDVTVSKKTLLEAMGLSIVPCTDKELETIRKTFTPDDIAYGLDKRMRRAWKVTNKATHKNYVAFKKEYMDGFKKFPTKLLWHGSRNENWWSIINLGLRIRPSNAIYTGSMFGDGVYFANKAKKSFGYTSSYRARYVNGSAPIVYMALFDVAVGNTKDTETNKGYYDMTFEKLRGMKDASGASYHSVFAHAGQQLYNDELIMYNHNQMTIKYLVEFDC